MSNPELEDLKRICNYRKITPEQLLEERVSPLQEKISNSQGELIVAFTNDYKKKDSIKTRSVYQYYLRKILYAGLITPKTRFQIEESPLGVFITGIRKPYSLRMNFDREWNFEKGDDGSFGNRIADSLRLLYFMDNPSEVTKNLWHRGNFGNSSTVLPVKRPGLELYIGNQLAVPFLEQNLEGWRYSQLSKLLEYDLPITKGIAIKTEREQLNIFNEIKELESKIGFYYKENIGQIDTLLGYSNIGRREEIIGKIFGLFEVAIKRGYHETGMQIRRQLDAGIVTEINLKDFFTQRKETLNL